MATGGIDRNMSEETFNYICTSCAEDNVIKEGIKYCVECKGYCCKNCVSVHKTYAPLKKHDLLDISTSEQTDQTSKLPSFPTERCSIHQGKVTDMYCGDHDVVGCYACIAIDHKNCTDIHSIPDDVDKITKDGEFEKTRQDLHDVTERIQSMLQTSNQKYFKKLEHAKQNSLLAITEHRREADEMLNRLEEDARREVESMYSQLKSKLLKVNERIESCLNNFVDLEERIRLAEGNYSQKFVCSKLARLPITTVQNDFHTFEKELEIFASDTVMTFVGNESVIDSLKQLDNLGHVKLANKNSSYRAKHCQDIVFKIPSDNAQCRIRSCCLLRDNELIITDNANKKLKRIDIANLSVIDYIDLPYDIHGVCCVKNNEVAVACHSDRMIQFVYVGQTMTPTRQMKLKHNCYHVAYMDNKLYVSDDEGFSVFIHDMVGTLLQTIYRDSRGNKLFLYSQQIALTESEDYMFVGANSGLVSLDKKGTHISTVKDPDMREAEGVCVDGRGNVFVAGRGSNKVVQLRYDGTKVGVITKKEDGIKTPVSLCFHPQLCKLFITMNNNIKMFDLE